MPTILSPSYRSLEMNMNKNPDFATSKMRNEINDIPGALQRLLDHSADTIKDAAAELARRTIAFAST
jgi:hypothetical protein